MHTFTRPWLGRHAHGPFAAAPAGCFPGPSARRFAGPPWLLWLAWLLWLPMVGRAQVSPGTVGAPCPPVATAAPFLDSSSAAPLERYLARAVAMNGLCDELVPAPFPWNQANDGRPCYRGGPPDDPASYNDSLSCRGLCSYPFCPDNFAADVALLVRLRASFVQYAASAWDSPENFIPGSPYLLAAGQTVARINAAYDCAGLARPLIQASVLENVDEGPVCAPPGTPCEAWMRPGPAGTNSGANRVPLPPYVIAEFLDEVPADTASAHYLDAAGAPRTDVYFNFFRLSYLFAGTTFSPDITKLEGRMWVFYQATTYINLGYTALHMGQAKLWGKLHLAEGPALAPALHRVAVLMNRVRRHARRQPATPLLVLTAEPMGDLKLDERGVVKFIDGFSDDGRSRYIFDFSTATMRPRETSPELDRQVGTNVGTRYRCPDVDPGALATPACTGQFMATIDPCHGFNFVPDGGGTTPLGQTFATQLPYVVYFDHSETVVRQPNGDLAPTGVLTPGNVGTWNWDDAGWFSAALSDACQADWLRFQFANVRSFTSHLSFLAAPGRLTNNLRVGLAPGSGQPARPEAGVPDYRLAAHPAAAAAVAESWEPTTPRVSVRATPGAGQSAGPCPQSTLFKRTFRQLPAWSFAVENPDATSIYSWHLTGPNGEEATTFGPSRTFLPVVAGSYTVVLRQDNLGLPTATHGLRTYPVPAVPMATETCLTRSERRAARRVAANPPGSVQQGRPATP